MVFVWLCIHCNEKLKLIQDKDDQRCTLCIICRITFLDSFGSSIHNMTPPVSYEIFELNSRPPAYSFR